MKLTKRESNKPNTEKVNAILKLKHLEDQKKLEPFLGAIQYLAKFIPKLSERTESLRKLLKKLLSVYRFFRYIKYGPLFVDQSRTAPERNETNKTKGDNAMKSKRNKTFEEDRDVNKNCDQTKFTSTKRREKSKPESKIRTINLNINSNLNSNFSPKVPLFKKEMHRDYIHWEV